MGTRISVASSVYNLAGDIKYRPQFLKLMVFNYALGSSGGSIGETITGGYLKGPGLRLRQYAKWARDSGYNTFMGVTSANLLTGAGVSNAVLLPHLPRPAGSSILLETTFIGEITSVMLAERWILANKPARFKDSWTVDFDSTTNEYVISWPGAGAANADDRFIPSDYDPAARYLYAKYITSTNDVPGEWVYGAPVLLAHSTPFPSVEGWTTIDPFVETVVSVVLRRTVTTTASYSDGRPDEVAVTETSATTTYKRQSATHQKLVYNGVAAPTETITSTEQMLYLEQFATIGVAEDSDVVTSTPEPGVSRTITTTTVQEFVDLVRQTRTDTRTITMAIWSDPVIFLYKQDSGIPDLDAMFALPVDAGQFYGYIPFRVDNESVSEETDPEAYMWSKKAFRKATAGSYRQTMKNIEDNESIKDIDYVYTVFAVSLNSRESAALEYIYLLFRRVMTQQAEGTDYARWEADYAAAKAINDTYLAWFQAQKDSTHPLFGTPEPPKAAYPDKPSRSLRVSSGTNAKMAFDMEITWSSIQESSGTGTRRAGARKGDLWWSVEPVSPPGGGDGSESSSNGGVMGIVQGRVDRTNTMTLSWQITPDTWQELTFTDLVHKNYIYRGRSVEIKGKDALLDPEESGFLVPMHEGIFRGMPLVRSTQMATACIYLVFNSYVVTKKKWYETGLFKLIVIIVAVIITIYTGGAGSGLLGTAASVGSTLGFSGMAAVVMGAVANTLAAMVLMSIIQKVATGVFGAKWGAIIGTVVGMIAMHVGTNMAAGSSFASSMGKLMQAPNIMKLSMAAGDAYSKYLTADTAEIVQKMEAWQANYNLEQKAIDDKYYEEFGVGSAVMSPLRLLSASSEVGYYIESTDAFTNRTLMVGSEVADMSCGLLNNFAQLTLTLDLP